MAGFGRSNSLTINTGLSNAAAGSSNTLFGGSTNTSQPQQSGGIFGSTLGAPSSQPQTTGSLFANSNQNANASSQSQQAGGLFGSTSQAPQTGGLFGSTLGSNTSQPQTAGGLFGSTLSNTTTSQPQQTGGLFGSTLGANRPATSGLFGSTTSQPQQQAGSLFGSTLGQKPSLFGSTTTQQPQQPQGGSMFGSNTGLNASTASQQHQQQQQQHQSSGRLFPALLSTNAPPSLPKLGQSTAAHQPASGLSIQDPSQIRGTTRFNDLSEAFQKQIEELDAKIQDQIKAKEKIDAFMTGHARDLATLGPSVAIVDGRLETVELAIDNDGSAIARLKDTVKAASNEYNVIALAARNLALPQQYHHLPPSYMQSAAAALDGYDPAALLKYFDELAAEQRSQMQGQLLLLAEVETHLGAVETSVVVEAEKMVRRQGGDGVKEQVRELARTMKWFEDAVLRVAENVGKAREGVVGVTVGM